MEASFRGKRDNLPSALHRREQDERYRMRVQQNFLLTESMVQRLGLKGELDAHTGCVNCLEWNEAGTILASGSDDVTINLWDPFRKKLLTTIPSGHQGNIFSVKFIPNTMDKLIVSGAADNKVRVHDVVDKELISACSCHTSRVKRIATDPTTAYLFWSAGEEGTIIQHDLRSHECTTDPKNPRNIFVDLRDYCGAGAEAKCIAINPMRPDMLAIGANDPFIRLYDRRMVKGPNTDKPLEKIPLDAVQYYVPGHLPTKMYDYKRSRGIAATFVAFNSQGTELLANLGGEQIYLFSMVPSLQRFPVCFYSPLPSPSTPPGHESGHSSKEGASLKKNGFHNNVPPLNVLPFGILKPISPTMVLPKEIEGIKVAANESFKQKNYVRAIQLYNEALRFCSNAPVLLANRAAAFLKRSWDGDVYCALLDSHKALLLDSNHYKAHLRLCRCLCELNRLCEAEDCLRQFRENFPAHSTDPALSEVEKQIKTRKDVAAKKKKREKERSRPGSDADFPVYNRNYFLRLSRPAETSRPEGAAADRQSDSPPGEDVGTDTSNDSHENSQAFLVNFSNSSTEASNDEDEAVLTSRGIDFSKRFCGHCNTTTDIKEANFFGNYIIAGSDDGSFFIWDKETCNIVRILKGDESIVNCLQPHPSTCLLATSGIENVIRLWTPLPQKEGTVNDRAVDDVENAATSNQRRMAIRSSGVLNLLLRLNGEEEELMEDPNDSERTVQCNTS